MCVHMCIHIYFVLSEKNILDKIKHNTTIKNRKGNFVVDRKN